MCTGNDTSKDFSWISYFLILGNKSAMDMYRDNSRRYKLETSLQSSTSLVYIIVTSRKITLS